MSDLKYLMLAIFVAALLPTGSGRLIGVDELVNSTVCAFRVKFDKDINRIPYKIKTIKCVAPTDQFCVANKIESIKCCHKANHMECVEMKDTVLVYNKTAKATQSIEVSVGCACMIVDAFVAKNGESIKKSGS